MLDLLLAREPHFPAATKLFSLFEEGRLEGFLSPLIFSNLFYILRKGMPGPEAINALRKLKLIAGILPVDDKILDLALSSTFKDFEDAMQYYTAVTHGIDALVTRNQSDYKAAKIPILTAAECVEVARSQDGKGNDSAA